jgi:hypothetical protein
VPNSLPDPFASPDLLELANTPASRAFPAIAEYVAASVALEATARNSELPLAERHAAECQCQGFVLAGTDLVRAYGGAPASFLGTVRDLRAAIADESLDLAERLASEHRLAGHETAIDFLEEALRAAAGIQ